MENTGQLYSAPFAAQFHEGRAQEFIIQTLIRRMHTCTLVKVLAVTPIAGKVGFLTVQPLLQDVDTNNTVLAQTPIYNVPYFRLQGGTSAVILDPAVGDIGLAIFAERDITNIKQTLTEGPPNTQRAYSSADGLYIGGVLNPDATQYVKFNPAGAGIEVTTPGTVAITAAGNVTVEAASCIFNCPVVFNDSVSSTPVASGNVSFASTIQAPDAIIGGVTQSTHVHGGVQTGGGNSSGPHN